MFGWTLLCSFCFAMAGIAAGVDASTGDRVGASKKGSLLIYSKVEIKWNMVGAQYVVAQDTFLDLTNDYPGTVFVMLQFINGDPPLEAVYTGDPGTLVERAHLGWNSVDCQIMLTQNEPTYWSALTGLPGGCQPFTVLDPGNPPGRPDLDGPAGSRVLRGYVLAWAVGIFDAVDPVFEEIRWNHLKGDAVIVNYATTTAWEYNAYAFQAVTAMHGYPTDTVPGQLLLDGIEYDTCFDTLLLDFYATGSQALSNGGRVVSVDTDLTLFPVSADLRQETEGPVLTKANFDIWNMEEVLMSSMDRCITCWDQTLLSNYDAPNYFLLQNLQTDKGKARINGIASPVVCGDESEDAALLGVAKKVLAFSGACTGLAEAGMTLVGMGEEDATILYDIAEPPDELMNDVDVMSDQSGRVNASLSRPLGAK